MGKSNSDKSENIEKTQSAWPVVLASIIFSLSAIYMFYLYGAFHWLRSGDSMRPLYKLHILRLIFGMLALIWAGWSFKFQPKWIAWCVTLLAILAMLSAVIIM